MTSLISVWMKAGVNLEKFCKDISIKVTNGVVTGMIRPAGKKDVTVTIAGLDFNTPDSFVMDYINKFGVVVDNTVIYTRFESGPFKGKFNGERRYQVDFSGTQRQMGTYHLIDGCKVRVYYRGNRKTCGRCHRPAGDCPGDAIAKNCALGGGPRVLLSEHMKELWKEIGFTPISFELDFSDKAEDENVQSEKDAAMIRENHFPALIKRPEHSKRDIEEVVGIAVKNFPKSLEEDQILEFLQSKGLPEEHNKENVTLNKGSMTTSVIIDGLSSSKAMRMLKEINFHETKQKHFEVPLYCKVLRNLTPEKKPVSKVMENRDDGGRVDPSAGRAANVKQIIPGLIVEEETKSKRKKKKEKKKSDGDNYEEQDFRLKQNVAIETDEGVRGFVFSDYSDSNDSEENFEDSKEVFSDTGESNQKSTPAKIDYVRGGSQTKLKTSKRQAQSPAEEPLKSRTGGKVQKNN